MNKHHSSLTETERRYRQIFAKAIVPNPALQQASWWQRLLGTVEPTVEASGQDVHDDMEAERTFTYRDVFLKAVNVIGPGYRSMSVYIDGHPKIELAESQVTFSFDPTIENPWAVVRVVRKGPRYGPYDKGTLVLGVEVYARDRKDMLELVQTVVQP